MYVYTRQSHWVAILLLGLKQPPTGRSTPTHYHNLHYLLLNDAFLACVWFFEPDKLKELH